MRLRVALIEESVRQGAEQAKREMHHEIPRCLLRLMDQADVHPELDGEGVQKWLDYEFEAQRWGVDPDVSRGELVELVEGSSAEIGIDEHHEHHTSRGAKRPARTRRIRANRARSAPLWSTSEASLWR